MAHPEFTKAQLDGPKSAVGYPEMPYKLLKRPRRKGVVFNASVMSRVLPPRPSLKTQ